MKHAPITLAQARTMAPAIATDHPHPYKSSTFTHVNTGELLESMLDNGFAIRSVRQARGLITTRGVDTGLYNQHIVVLRDAKAFHDLAVGDSIPEIVIINSHDGSGCFMVTAGLFRLLCLNGMVVGDSYESLRLQHRWMAVEEITAGARKIWEHMPILMKWREDAVKRELSTEEKYDFAEKAMVIRFPTRPVQEMPFDSGQLLSMRRDEDVGDNLWKTYQRVQENVIKGGIEGRSGTGRITRMREITGVQADLEINRSLWDLADTYLKAA